MQYLALSLLLLALGAGALPQASNPTILAPVTSNFDKREDGPVPVIGYFQDENCHGPHIGSEIPMNNSCTKFSPSGTPPGTYLRFKISWHHGPGKVRFFLTEDCNMDEEFDGLVVRTDEHHEWKCETAWDWKGVTAMMIPQ
ncbi:MAG: hypothetical protein Q9195_002555 [Heterodermia aff. obscurata]